MSRVIIALDHPSAAEAFELVDQLGDEADFYKVGLELFTREGPGIVTALRERGKRIFLDLKLHDIPNTVARAVEAAAALGVDLATIHVTGGARMLEAAAAAAEGKLRLLGVTLLTSFSPAEVEQVWDRELASIRDEVVRLSELAQSCGLHGVIASPHEVDAVKRRCGPSFLVVTPGIRLSGDETHDQARVATPVTAVEAGADYLVVGRSVTAADEPESAFERLRAELAS